MDVNANIIRKYIKKLFPDHYMIVYSDRCVYIYSLKKPYKHRTKNGVQIEYSCNAWRAVPFINGELSSPIENLDLNTEENTKDQLTRMLAGVE